MDKKIAFTLVISRNTVSCNSQKIKVVISLAAIKAIKCECVILSLAISRLVNDDHYSDFICPLSAGRVRDKGQQRKYYFS